MLLHEFAHNLNMIPRDGGNAVQSAANTNTIIQKCAQSVIDNVH